MVSSPAARTSWRTIAMRALAVVITIALAAWFVTDARWQGAVASLRRLEASTLLGVAVLFAISYALRGARIHGEFRDEIGPGNYPRILRLSLVHNALVNVLPFRSGEAAFPFLLSRWFGIGVGRAVVSLLWLRAQDACVMLALAALLWPDLPLALRVLAIVVIVAGAWGVPAWARRHPVIDPESAGRLGKVRALLARSTRANAAGWIWTVANWCVKLVAETWLLGLVLAVPGRALSIGVTAVGAIGAELAAILPVQGVAGFGTFEAGAAALMRTQGIAMSDGLEAALVLHAVVLALALLAGGLAAIALPGAREARDD